MKKLFIATIVLFTFIAVYGAPGQLRSTGSIEWNYNTNSVITNLLFKIYSSTNINDPVSTWPLIGTVQGTNWFSVVSNKFVYRFTFNVVNAQQFFSGTASNWHGESLFSNVALTPAPPQNDVSLRLGP